LLFEPWLIVLLEVVYTLNATWGNEFEVTFGSLLKINLNLKFFNTWRGVMVSRYPIMNAKYRCNTHKHKKQEKMTRMRRRKKLGHVLCILM